MSATTWNFPVWQARDKGPSPTPPSVRCTAGSGFETLTLPFSTEISGVFSWFADSATCADANELQTLTSIGYQGATNPAFAAYLYMDSGTPANSHMRIWMHDEVGGVTRYRFNFQDDDGASNLAFDKWYQFAFSATATSFQYVLNGSTTPKVTTVTNTPGALNLSQGTERWWHIAPSAAWGAANPFTVTVQWPTVALGPSAFEASALDLSVQANIDRIFDTDGNLKNPGENGSLWWNDTYDEAAGFKPDVYMQDGSARFEKGSAGLTWTSITGGAWAACPGGLRKFYE